MILASDVLSQYVCFTDDRSRQQPNFAMQVLRSATCRIKEKTGDRNSEQNIRRGSGKKTNDEDKYNHVRPCHSFEHLRQPRSLNCLFKRRRPQSIDHLPAVPSVTYGLYTTNDAGALRWRANEERWETSADDGSLWILL